MYGFRGKNLCFLPMGFCAKKMHPGSPGCGSDQMVPVTVRVAMPGTTVYAPVVASWV